MLVYEVTRSQSSSIFPWQHVYTQVIRFNTLSRKQNRNKAVFTTCTDLHPVEAYPGRQDRGQRSQYRNIWSVKHTFGKFSPVQYTWGQFKINTLWVVLCVCDCFVSFRSSLWSLCGCWASNCICFGRFLKVIAVIQTLPLVKIKPRLASPTTRVPGTHLWVPSPLQLNLSPKQLALAETFPGPCCAGWLSVCGFDGGQNSLSRWRT